MQAVIYPVGLAEEWPSVLKPRFPALILHWAPPKIPKPSLREPQVMELCIHRINREKNTMRARNYPRCSTSFAGWRYSNSPRLMPLWHCIRGVHVPFPEEFTNFFISSGPTHKASENENKEALGYCQTVPHSCQTVRLLFFNA